ncbi:hypothetical protein EDB89DRAFT_1912726 [Lactarius sanguifluus]|nr:hypothetical protein EDB89DRAFT_1912726 [Lactarius sanguifluus]
MAVSQRGLACLVGGGVAWAVGLAWRVGRRGGRLVVVVAGSAPCQGGHGNTMMGRKLMGEGIERVSLAWLDEGWKWEEMGGVKQEPGRRDLLKENRVEWRLNLWRGKGFFFTLFTTCCSYMRITPTAKMEDGLMSWALAQSLPPCAGLPLRSSPSRHAARHGSQIPAMSPQHHAQDPATTNPPRHDAQDPTANLPPCHLNTVRNAPPPPTPTATANAPPCRPNTARKTTPHADSHHTAPTRMQGPVTADPPHRPNMACKTPPSPTCLHATPTRMQGPITADPPRRPNTARKTHHHATPTRHARPVITLPRHRYKARHHRPATPPQHGAQDPAVANPSSRRPDMDARPTADLPHRLATPPNTLQYIIVLLMQLLLTE